MSPAIKSSLVAMIVKDFARNPVQNALNVWEKIQTPGNY